MTILFLAANPATLATLDLEEALRCLERELGAVRFRGQITLIGKHAVQPDDLIRHIRAENPNVVHFSGHGTPEGIILRNQGGCTPDPGHAALLITLRCFAA